MRVGVVRSDINKVYLADVENRSQRCFSSEPAGQSRYFHKPTDAELTAVLNAYATLTLKASDAAATVDTTAGANVFKVKTKASAAFTTINVTVGATTTKVQIAADLNAGFLAAGLPLVASIVAPNHIQLDTVAPNSGPAGYVAVDVDLNSTLNPVVGFTAGATSGLALSAFKSAVYPTASTIDVSSATIVALSTFSLLSTPVKTAFVAATADLVAPTLVETGPTLLSFAYGNLSKLRSASFQPGGARIGLPAGVGVAIVANDGSTPFTL
jgi:hypothetical protein